MQRLKKHAVLFKGTFGLLLIACSYIPHFLTPQNYGFWGSLFYGAIYYLGGIYIADAVIIALSGKSLLNTIIFSPFNRVSFFKLSLVGAIPFSLAVSTFGGLWYFPHWTATEYYVLGYILLGWAFYFLFLTICYQAFKLVLDVIVPQRKPVKSYYGFERKSYKALGIVGGWVAIMVITVAFQDSRWLTNFHVSVNSVQKPYLYWYWWLIAVSAWIILCEFIEYKRRRSSLFKDTIHGYFNPLLAIFLCGISLAVTNEYQNLPIALWHYANFPWTDYTVMKIPLFVVLSWPIQIAAFVEFWRGFGEKNATDMLFANSFSVNKSKKQRAVRKRSSARK